MGRVDALLAKLATPGAPRRIVVIVLILALPTLFVGFQVDDYILLYQSRHGASDWAGSGPFDLFRFIDPAHCKRLMDGAGLAWWTYERTTYALLRPISSVTHAADFALWPRQAFAMHLHNLVWFVLLAAIVAKTYEVLIEERWVFGLAFAMFALDSAHGAPLGWISNRNALIGGVFSVAAILCHHRSRSSERRWYAPLGWLAFALALFAAELSIACLGYLISHAIFLDRSARGRRALSLLPYAALSTCWAYARAAFDYGAVALNGYIDPTREPLEFARVAPLRMWSLLATQFARTGAEFGEIVPGAARVGLLLTAAGVLGCAGFLTWPALRTRPVCRFFAGGALAALVPICAGPMSDRLLMLVGFGVMPVLAYAIRDALARGAPAIRRRIAVAFTFVHLVVDPLLLVIATLMGALLLRSILPGEDSLGVDPGLRNQSVFVARVPNSVYLSWIPVMRDTAGEPRPRHLYWLMAHPKPGELERLAEDKLRLRAPDGVFEDSWEERSSRYPLQRGERIELSEVTITVLEVTADGRPSVCDFEFRRALESPEYRWLTWRHERLEPLALPRLGEKRQL